MINQEEGRRNLEALTKALERMKLLWDGTSPGSPLMKEIEGTAQQLALDINVLAARLATTLVPVVVYDPIPYRWRAENGDQLLIQEDPGNIIFVLNFTRNALQMVDGAFSRTGKQATRQALEASGAKPIEILCTNIHDSGAGPTKCALPFGHSVPHESADKRVRNP